MEPADLENPPDAKRFKLDTTETNSSIAADTPCESKENKVEIQTDDFKADPRELQSTDIQTVLTEKDVGISEYISDFEGFQGVIKQR